MANESAFVWDDNFVSHSDRSTATGTPKQFYVFKLLSTADCDVVSDDADPPFGVLQNNPKTGGAAVLRILGISKVVSDGSGTAIAYGDPVGIDDSGRAVKIATPDQPMIGVALDASSAAGTIIPVALRPWGFFRTAAS